MIIDKALYRSGRRDACGDLSDELEAIRQTGSETDFIWIGLKDPTMDELEEVNEELGLGLHPLAIEDAVKGRQRAKIESYGRAVFVVLKTLSYIEATSDVETGELMVHVGEHFVLTIRRGELSPLAGVRRELEADREKLALGPMSALHAIMDRVVDQYREIDVELARDIDEIEEAVFSEGLVSSDAIYRLKREVLEFRRAITPLIAPLRMLHTSPRTALPHDELRLLFRDVDDHLHFVADRVESYDRLLSDVLSANLAKISVQQNADMRRISAWVAIAAVPTMIAGIYGMNFDNMPELHWHYGYFLVLGLMATVCVGLYATFKKVSWL
ncbi:magnesium transporter CorA [Knoellia flava TL1]|uniref:Magnesium transport protein CorA n=2 Tax=Knoellia flava TaxID=913969 RepID=A0A8H9KP43_9MICO|nr:magnesium/cobalt transporter CorA [Knoellia flava]KGN30369.1 magnesium transporter CorA [Knoellia flava TL1]GGB66776.1 magnesium transport protein CorA [Knoellia flava]